MEELPSAADLMYVVVSCHMFTKYSRSLIYFTLLLGMFLLLPVELIIRDIFAAFPFSILLQKMYCSGRHPMVYYTYYIYSNVQITG